MLSPAPPSSPSVCSIPCLAPLQLVILISFGELPRVNPKVVLLKDNDPSSI